MKKILQLFLIASLILTFENCICQWVWQNPYPVGNPLRGIKFLNDNTGIAVGYSENILKSTDGGSNWALQDIGLYNNRGNIYSVYFLNSQTGFIAGNKWYSTYSSEGLLLKTTNAGLNWFIPTTDTLIPLYSIQFLNSQTGFVLGYNSFQGMRHYKTTNGGLSWTYSIYNLFIFYYNIFFINESTGFLSNYMTTNGGINWSAYLPNTSITSSYFINSLTGWAVSYTGKIYKTINSGINWSEYKIDTTKQFLSVEFTDANTGWVYGNYGIIYKTTNGGIN